MYVDIIGSFILTHDLAYALVYLDELENTHIKSATNKNHGSWFNKYRDFILSCVMVYPATATTSSVLPQPTLATLKKSVTKQRIKSLTYKFDAMDSLIANIGVASFVRLAIENSIFFDEGEAINRFDQVTNSLNTGSLLYARKSQDKTLQQNLWYVDPNQGPICPIKLDPNNNQMVNQMINHVFGYCSLITKFFQNYIISHIWGKAYDPRYFTSLWNLALVPACANHLLDKPSALEGTVAKKLIETIMAICFVHYDMSNLPWNSSPKWMSESERPDDPRNKKQNDVISGTYTIRVLRPCNGNSVGEIDLKTITI
jgi:hypothetical protein